MSAINTEYGQVWEQVQRWPAAERRSLAEQIRKSLQTDQPACQEEWTETKNARRCQLIDKDIQESLSEPERQILLRASEIYKRRRS